MDKNLQENEALSLSLKSNIKTIVIDGIRFEMNLDDPTVYKALFEFKENHEYNPLNVENDVDALLEDCEETIDLVLGKGTCEKLFKARDMKMYLLVNELANVFLDNFMKDEIEKSKKRNKEEMEQLGKILDSMSNISKMMNYADNKYGKKGMKNYVSKKRTSKKHRNKQK